VSIGLTYVYKGITYSDLALPALNAAGSFTPDQIVATLWRNVVDSATSAFEKHHLLKCLPKILKLVI
jgi:predicted lipoprotein